MPVTAIAIIQVQQDFLDLVDYMVYVIQHRQMGVDKDNDARSGIVRDLFRTVFSWRFAPLAAWRKRSTSLEISSRLMNRGAFQFGRAAAGGLVLWRCPG